MLFKLTYVLQYSYHFIRRVLRRQWMSNSQNTRYIYTSQIKKRRYTLPQYLPLDDASKAVQTPRKDIPHQDEVIQHKTQDCCESDKKLIEHEYILPPTHMETSRSSISTYSCDEETIEDLIERMKNEEQQMENKLESMEYDEYRIKYEITLMKHYENRMEHEIELMKRREKSVEEVVLVRIPIYNDEKYMEDKIEQMKKHEKYMNYEIERMKHYEMRLKNEIRYMKNEIESIACLSMPKHHDEFRQSEIELRKRAEKFEELCHELEKRERNLEEHSNEMKKRETKLEEHCDERIKCEYELDIVRNKITQEEERVEHEKQLRKQAIERRKNYEIRFMESRQERIIHEIKLLEKCNERRQPGANFVNEEKLRERDVQYFKLREKLSENGENLYNLYQQEEKPRYQLRGECQSQRLEYHDQLESSTESIRGDMNSAKPDLNTYFESLMLIDQPKYDIFISSTYQNNSIIQHIKSALPQWYSTYVKGNFSSTNIKICLDNTSTAVVAVINKAYELSLTCQADMIHIFKRQFPLVLVIFEDDFKPNTDWLNLVWHAQNKQKVFLDFPDFEANLRNAIADVQWSLSPNLNISKLTQSTVNNRSNRFLGDHHEWTIAYNNPSQVSQNYRQLITDPLRIATDTKLQNIYYHYIRLYFENSTVMSLFKKGANENGMHSCIRAYTLTGPFSATLNHHLAANILFYFKSTLYESVDYQLVSCLIDFVALCIYHQELQPYVFTGIVYRGMRMLEKDLFKYVVGSRIMNTSFLSTSKDKQVVECFCGQVLCTYVINDTNNRRTALDISSISCIPHEREVLILPFSAFYVKSVTRSLDRTRNQSK